MRSASSRLQFTSATSTCTTSIIERLPPVIESERLLITPSSPTTRFSKLIPPLTLSTSNRIEPVKAKAKGSDLTERASIIIVITDRSSFLFEMIVALVGWFQVKSPSKFTLIPPVKSSF